MIVVAIVALLAAVALPSYQSYMLKSRRADAWSLLQSGQLAQERHRLTNTTYASASTALTGLCPTSGACTSEHYQLAVSGADATSFTLTATPRTGSPQTKDTACASIVLSLAAGVLSRTQPACWSN